MCIPDDIWRLLLQFCSEKESMRLGSTCSWLHQVVLGNISSITLTRTPTSFPAARFTSLQHVFLCADVSVEGMLPVLLACTQLQEIELYCWYDRAIEALADTIAHFPRCCSVHLRRPKANAQLGKALASCPTLREVCLYMGQGRDRSAAPRTDYVADFLAEVSALAGLRRLDGIAMRDEDDCKALCAAVGAWSELEELVVLCDPDAVDGEPIAAPFGGLLAAVGRSCPRMRCLTMLYDFGEQALGTEDVEGLACMTQLRELWLSGFSLSTSLAPLCSLTKLEELELDRCSLGGAQGKQLAALIRDLPITQFSLSLLHHSSDAIADLLRGIAAPSRLCALTVTSRYRFEPEAGDKETLGAALAEAVCRSSVCSMTITLPVCLMSFLRAWNGRTPAAAMTTLSLGRCESQACVGEEYAELLLRCARSCPTMRKLTLTNRTHDCVGDIAAVVAAVKAEPVLPTVLTVQCDDRTRREYADVAEELAAAGLALQ
eukprot:PLAT2475.2.p1 GENE.PLAT2475.2~~PLAT2475.2.p1  ORF type:complete len:489 (-),score=85.93 PLAT2475.2:18-1484(-)